MKQAPGTSHAGQGRERRPLLVARRSFSLTPRLWLGRAVPAAGPPLLTRWDPRTLDGHAHSPGGASPPRGSEGSGARLQRFLSEGTRALFHSGSEGPHLVCRTDGVAKAGPSIPVIASPSGPSFPFPGSSFTPAFPQASAAPLELRGVLGTKGTAWQAASLPLGVRTEPGDSRVLSHQMRVVRMVAAATPGSRLTGLSVSGRFLSSARGRGMPPPHPHAGPPKPWCPKTQDAL